MAYNIFGIDIGSDSLKVTQVEKGFRSYEIVRMLRRKISGMDEAEVAETLSSALKELGFDSEEDQVAGCYPGAMLSSRTLDIPLKQRHQIVEALPYEIESQSPFNANDFVADFVTIAASDSGSKIFVVIALKKDLESFLKIYSMAGLDPDFVVPEPLALTSLFTQKEATKGLRILVDIGAGKTAITVLNGEKPISFHTINEGLGQIYSVAEEERVEDATASRLPINFEADKWKAPMQKLADKLALEIKRLIMSASVDIEDAGEIVITLSGGAGNSRIMATAIAKATGEKVSKVKLPVEDVEIDDDKTALNKPPIAIFAGALGAAIGMADAEKRERVNLRIGDFEKKRRFGGDRGQYIVAGVFLGVALMISLASFVVEGYRLGAEYESLKADIRAKFTKALPRVTRIVAESQQLENALARLDEKSDALGSALLDRDAFLDRLLDVSRAVPADIRLDVEELVYEWGRMTISGRTESFEKVEILKNNIAKFSWVGKVTVDKAKAAPSAGSISFRLEIKTI